MGIDSIAVIINTVVSCLGGVLLFMAIIVHVTFCRHRKDDSELPCLRELIRWGRFVTGVFTLLLLPLFWNVATGMHPVATPITSLANGGSWNFGWGRPSMHFMLALVGVFLDYHPAARMSYVVGMSQAIFLDILSSYDIGKRLKCVRSKKCAPPKGYSVWGLRLLQARDHTSVVFGACALLLVFYISLVIGTCRIRYSFQRLHSGSHSRVKAMRTELAKLELKTILPNEPNNSRVL